MTPCVTSLLVGIPSLENGSPGLIFEFKIAWELEATRISTFNLC